MLHPLRESCYIMLSPHCHLVDNTDSTCWKFHRQPPLFSKETYVCITLMSEADLLILFLIFTIKIPRQLKFNINRISASLQRVLI